MGTTMYAIQMFEPVHKNWHTAHATRVWNQAVRLAEKEREIERKAAEYGQPIRILDETRERVVWQG